ncbi:MAG TPA: hypothetical protein DDX39_06020 [Bacteroidales bacterium]|nr:MAG: hypothetical protein A2W98_07285 [Bacteroidetes bacterium GWF2_33_38]OFY73380.1 MAG: hypothetical protein A2265_03735 [Bacteroidetes bacterium RIFOXYA12_FULL_33_9]HBF88182.1 hypothetical protein [Bacteroidales bacterium]
MNFKTLLISQVLFILIISGCAVYYPQVTPPNLINKKGDLNVQGGGTLYSPYMYPDGVYGSASYGINSFISSQVYSSYKIFSGANFEGNISLYKNITPKIFVSGTVGYSYGFNKVEMWNMKYGDYTWKGNYNLQFGKIIFSKTSKLFEWGTQLKIGVLSPDYTKKYNGENDEIIVKNVNQNGISYEPGFFVKYNSSSRMEYYVQLSACYIEPINKPDYYTLPYWYFGNVGFGVSYKLNKSE